MGTPIERLRSAAIEILHRSTQCGGKNLPLRFCTDLRSVVGEKVKEFAEHPHRWLHSYHITHWSRMIWEISIGTSQNMLPFAYLDTTFRSIPQSEWRWLLCIFNSWFFSALIRHSMHGVPLLLLWVISSGSCPQSLCTQNQCLKGQRWSLWWEWWGWSWLTFWSWWRSWWLCWCFTWQLIGWCWDRKRGWSWEKLIFNRETFFVIGTADLRSSLSWQDNFFSVLIILKIMMK